LSCWKTYVSFGSNSSRPDSWCEHRAGDGGEDLTARQPRFQTYVANSILDHV
jgi:hypothetical protein